MELIREYSDSTSDEFVLPINMLENDIAPIEIEIFGHLAAEIEKNINWEKNKLLAPNSINIRLAVFSK